MTRVAAPVAGNTTELWVEPRLRGFVVTNDQRNPPSRVGQFLPYAAGWRKAVPGGRRIPAAPGAPALRDVRLRVATARAELWTMCAIERDLRRRVREGEVEYLLQPKRPATSKWVPRMLFAAAIVALVLTILHSLGWLLLGVFAFTFGMFAVPTARCNVRRLRIHSGRIDIERTDGSTISRPLSALRTMRHQLDARQIVFDDGESAWVVWPVADKSLWAALRAHYTRPTAEVEARHARNAWYRMLYVYTPIFAIAMGIGPVLLKVPANQLLSPSAVAVYKQLAIGALVLFVGPMWLMSFAIRPIVRRRVARMRRKDKPRPASPQFIFEPLESERAA